MGLIRLEPRLECGGGSAVQNGGFVCPVSFPEPHPSASLLSWHSFLNRWLFWGKNPHFLSVLGAGEAEPGSFLAVLPREDVDAAGNGGSCGRAFYIAQN